MFRSIFRACYTRFQKNASKEKYISRVSLEANPGRHRKQTWGMKNEEYIADFCLVSRRTLDEAQYQLFRFHYLLGADWKLCCRRLKLDRGSFFHEIYRIEQKLGRAFRELEPYALFPLDEYFNSTPRLHPPLTPFPVQTDDEVLGIKNKKTAKAKKVIQFPVKKAA